MSGGTPTALEIDPAIVAFCERLVERASDSSSIYGDELRRTITRAWIYGYDYDREKLRQLLISAALVDEAAQ